MAKTIEDLFIYTRHGADLLVLILFFANFKQVKAEKGLWALSIYCFIDLSISILENYIPLPLSFLLVLLIIFTLVEYLLFAYFIQINIKKKSFRQFIYVASAIFVVFLIIHSLTAKVVSIDSIPIGIETILIFSYAFYYFYEQMNDTQNLFIYNTYSFWVITGMLLYLSGSFFIYIFGNYIDRILLDQYFFITNVFYTIATLLYAIGIIIFAKQQKMSKMKSHKISLSHLSF